MERSRSFDANLFQVSEECWSDFAIIVGDVINDGCDELLALAFGEGGPW